MSDEDLTLEIELDLPMEPADVARYRSYMRDGLSEREAARQTAQDILGGLGAIVQGAQAVRS